MSEPYHSALGRYSYQAETPSYNSAEFPHGEVHYYDVTSGMAKMGFIEKADVIYSDLPWRNGYHKFYKRSGLIPRLSRSEKSVEMLLIELRDIKENMIIIMVHMGIKKPNGIKKK